LPHCQSARFYHTAVAALLSAALLSVVAGQRPAHSDSCADSPAASRAGRLYAEGDSTAALPFAQHALRRAEISCGAQTTARIALLADLAAINQDLGRYVAAEKSLRQVIEIKQAALSPEEENKPSAGLSNMIIDLNNLAFVYGAHGKFEAAGKLFELVLEIVEKSVGGTHIIVSPALKNLAGNYRARGELEKARPLLSRAAQIEALSADNIPANWAATLGLLSPPTRSVGYASEAEAPQRLLDAGTE